MTNGLALRLAIPNKGRLSEDAVALLQKAGIKIHQSSNRTLLAKALEGRLEILFLRAQDIPGFVAAGSVHAGITGLDCISEAEVEVREIMDLGFGKCRLVLAAPQDGQVKSIHELPDGARVATSFPAITKAFAAKIGKKWRVIEVHGACEATPAMGVADAIVDLTSTGSTMMMNHLVEIEAILDSSCKLIATSVLDAGLEKELQRLAFAIGSVVTARGKRYLLADIPRSILPEVETFLPGMGGPSVVELAGNPDMVAIQVVVSDLEIFDAVERLKRLGAKGIAVLPIDRLVA